MIDCKVVEHIATLANSGNGYTKELNLVSWNDAEPKYDIRTWVRSEQHGVKMCKGVTLTEEEMQNLIEAMIERNE